MTTIFPYGGLVPGFSGRTIGSTDTIASLTITDSLTVDTIDEFTTGAGVSFPQRIRVDTIDEFTTGAGVSFPHRIHVDTIDEFTTDNGVVVEQMRIRADTLITPAIDIVSMVLTGPATNISIAIAPKGNGALIAAVPDATPVGGDARGRYAVDLQMNRSASNMVASGGFSVIGGGQDNMVTRPWSTIPGGLSNTINGTSSACVISGGATNTITDGDGCAIGGGGTHTIDTNTTSGFIGGGFANHISNSNYGTIGGGQNNRILDSTTGTIAGGVNGKISTGSNYGTIAGGFTCQLLNGSTISFIGGGNTNVITNSTLSAICGGVINHITNSDHSFTGCGNNSLITGGSYSAIICGDACTCSFSYCLANGRRAKATSGNGAYVFADSQNADFSSTAGDQFSLRFANGYRMTGGKFGLNDQTNHYTAGTGQTVGAVTADIFTIATTANTTYIYTMHIVAATAAGDTASFQKTVRAKNVAGVVTVSAAFNAGSDLDAAINTAVIDFVASGTNVVAQATGVAAQTIDWRGMVVETMYTFA